MGSSEGKSTRGLAVGTEESQPALCARVCVQHTAAGVMLKPQGLCVLMLAAGETGIKGRWLGRLRV